MRNRRPRRRRALLAFVTLSVGLMLATVHDAPAAWFGLLALGWVGALAALVMATQTAAAATHDAGSGEGGDEQHGDGDGSGDGGGDGGGGDGAGGDGGGD